MARFQDGGTPRTRIGWINENWQICLGHRGVKGTDYNQKAYMMVCLKCGYQYGANGSDVPGRTCPSRECDDGHGENLQF